MGLWTKQRLRVDVLPVPISFRVGHGPDREMKVAGAGDDIACIADITDNLALPREISFRQPIGITREMGVVVDGPIIRAHLINSDAAPIAVEQFDDLSRKSRNDRRAAT